MTSVARYGALGKNTSHSAKVAINVSVGVSFVIYNSEITYGIHAKNRFHIRYEMPVCLNASPRERTRIIAIVDASRSD